MSCPNCKHSCSIPGDAHIACNHPSAKEYTDIVKLVEVITQGSTAVSDIILEFGFKINPIGIDNDWFIWPANFDPVWMEGKCNKFELKG